MAAKPSARRSPVKRGAAKRGAPARAKAPAAKAPAAKAGAAPTMTEKKKPGPKPGAQAAAAKKTAANLPPLPPPPPGPPADVAGVGRNADADAAKDASEKDAAPAKPPPPPALEDWWLVRDSQGKVGWVMSRRIDVDVPDEVAQYAEGQRIVAAYLLRKVADPESNFPDKLAPEYVTVVNPYADGLPYDFNQVRVFTWNVRKHRYETAFRQRNLQGYLPVTVENQTLDNAGPVPTFSFKQGVGDSVAIDPDTGAARPAATETLTYRLDGEQVHTVLPGAPAAAKTPQTPRPAAPSSADKKAPRTRRRHRK